MKPLLLLDRDGVVNDPPVPPNRYILSEKQLRLRSGVIEEIKRIQSFASVAVISNQQCVGKMLITRKQVEEINDVINRSLVRLGGSAIRFFICFHLDQDKCWCRKPRPGLLFEAIDMFRNGDIQDCLFIGDQQIDFEAAMRARIKFRLTQSEEETIQILSKLSLSNFST